VKLGIRRRRRVGDINRRSTHEHEVLVDGELIGDDGGIGFGRSHDAAPAVGARQRQCRRGDRIARGAGGTGRGAQGRSAFAARERDVCGVKRLPRRGGDEAHRRVVIEASGDGGADVERRS
jgi:hypothetical protein